MCNKCTGRHSLCKHRQQEKNDFAICRLYGLHGRAAENFLQDFRLSLLDFLTNVVIFRSLTAAFGISSSEAGYILTNPETINVIKDSCLLEPISSTVHNTIFAALSNEEALSSHIHQVHEESLRLATALSRLKVQCRLTTADFLLMRVADPKNVGNYLARYEAPVDNLDGYSQLETINGTIFNRRIPTTG